MKNSTVKLVAEILVEPLQVKDLKAAIQLEREAQLSPTNEAQLLKQLQSPYSLLLAAFFRVRPRSDNVQEHQPNENSEVTRNIVGLLSGWVVTDELEIDNLVVAESARRQGVGSGLLMEGLRVARQKGADNAYLEVREDNLAALNLYTSVGFVVVGRRKDYYHNPLKDALRLWLDIHQ